MRVTLERSGLLSEVVGIVSDLVSEIKMKFTSDGLEVIAVDPTNAAMLLFKLPASAFSNYEVDKVEDIDINLDDFKQVLRRGRQERISMQTDEGRLLVNFGEDKKAFVLSLINIEGEDRKEPDLKFTSSVKINSTNFQEAIDDCSVVADSILFDIGDKGFLLDAKSSLHSASVKLLSESFAEGAKSRYSLDYLQKMAKAAKIADEVRIQFSNEFPLRLSYITPEKAELRFILAPRVETE